MSGYVIAAVYAALILMLGGLLAYLIGRANDDDQWPQG